MLSMSQINRDITEITRAGAQYRTDSLAPYGLKACHASYLTEICDCPGISQDKPAARICINKSNVARQAAILEEEGFITRAPAPQDKRCLELYPTEKALALLPTIREILGQWETYLTEDLTEEEKTLITTLLLRMRDKASAWMEGK